MSLVFVLEVMECDWDCPKCIKGIFSDAELAVEYVRNNYYLIVDERDVCIPNYPIRGVIFSQYGYDVHPKDLLEDEGGLYYNSQYDDEEPDYKEYVTTETVFTIKGVKLDELIKG
ncbi:MAG: hypothetical protein RR959_06045 [Erysipelotrichaceae bacterium]